MMRLAAVTLALGLLAAAPALAGAEDAKWIAQCQRDNADAKGSAEVVTKYCTCMNSKMDENETRSISQWEKANPGAMKACEAEAGWK